MKKTTIYTILIITAAVFMGAAARASLVAHWKFDETTGASVLTDCAGSSNGSVGDGVLFVPSQMGNAGDFSATSNFITLGSPDVLDLGICDFTMTGWFKSPQVPTSSAYQFILYNGVHGSGGVNLMLYRGDRANAGRFTFDMKGTTSNITVVSNSRVDDNTWHWFAAMVVDATAYLYIDGVLQASSANIAGATANAPAATVAKFASNYDGLIDDFRIYNTALSATVDANQNLIAGDLYYLWLGEAYKCKEILADGYGFESDFNKDCTVDILDLSVFAQNWLEEVNTSTIPIFWKKPNNFSEDTSEHGLDYLNGVSHFLVYDPLATAACVDEGGTGIYESTAYGTYNHHPKLMIFGDKFITYWTNHAKDENGPGQRLLARIGTFNASMDNISWGGGETLIEIAPAPVAVRRRTADYDIQTVHGIYASGRMMIINNKLYSEVTLIANYGWTNNMLYHGTQNAPIPAENFSASRTGDFNKGLDVWWNMGTKYYQRWRIDQNIIVPDTIMYKTGTLKNPLEVTPSVFKNLATLTPLYNNAVDFSEAPADFRDDIQNGQQIVFYRNPKYASGTSSIAADGINGLAHDTEFCRPDGKWVAIRDNLFNRGRYYASIKNHQNDNYPPAWRTNLYGDAMPSAGELPDGRPYIICNSIGRKDMFITTSTDGIIFDSTWLLLHSDRVKSDDGLYKGGGPQYFQSYVLDENILVVYSITKEQIGFTKIPTSLLK